MRKKNKFTPTKLRRWEKTGRGSGTLDSYSSWHQVTRDDPASRGLSQWSLWAKTTRPHHLLSIKENIAFIFATMLPHLVDVLESFPLPTEDDSTPLPEYLATRRDRIASGTLEIAKELGIRHPVVRDGDDSQAWIFSTDLVLVFCHAPSQFDILAISVKSTHVLGKRTRELLLIEREYWRRLGIDWILITPLQYERSVATTVRLNAPWGIPKTAEDITSQDLIDRCVALAPQFHGRSLTECLRRLIHDLHLPMDHAQQVFWQSVWAGRLHIDLSRNNWASAPIHLVDRARFIDQNPIAARRTQRL